VRARCVTRNEPDAQRIFESGTNLARTQGAGALSNAVYHATGRRIRDLPITLDKLIA
jgi:hypothetical protein